MSQRQQFENVENEWTLAGSWKSHANTRGDRPGPFRQLGDRARWSLSIFCCATRRVAGENRPIRVSGNGGALEGMSSRDRATARLVGAGEPCFPAFTCHYQSRSPLDGHFQFISALQLNVCTGA